MDSHGFVNRFDVVDAIEVFGFSYGLQTFCVDWSNRSGWILASVADIPVMVEAIETSGFSTILQPFGDGRSGRSTEVTGVSTMSLARGET